MESKRLRFELFVADVSQSLDFYGSVLGLSPPESFSLDGYVPVSDGLITIGLQNFAALPPDHHFRRTPDTIAKGTGVEIVIEVENIDEAYATARAAATTFGGQTEPLQARPWGKTDFRVIDPDGYYIRVTN